MTHEQILTKAMMNEPQQILKAAIYKAMANGWQPVHPVYGPKYKGKPYLILVGDASEILRYFDPENYDSVGYEWLIFNHQFAKALWGEDRVFESSGELVDEEIFMNLGADAVAIAWQHHLQQLVIAPDPIKYLREHI